MAEINIDDPCAVLKALKERKIAMLTGGETKTVRYRSDTGAEQQLDTHRQDMRELNAAIAQYQVLCEATQGKSARRVILAG